MPWARVWTGGGILLLGAGLAVLGPTPVSAPPWSQDGPTWRPVEGRLAGLAHAPSGIAPAQRTLRDRRNLTAAIARLGDASAATSVRRSALKKLQVGDLAGAVGELELGAALGDDYLSALAGDLAALYLERSRQPAHSFEAVQALDLLAQRSNRTPVETFNLALTLERFGLRAAARRAWWDAARLDPDSSWSTEAEHRTRLSARPPLERSWGAWRTGLLSGRPIADAEIGRWSAELPGILFDTTLYEVMGQWARQCGTVSSLENPRCGRLLYVARKIALSLENRVGPQLFQAIRQAEAAGPTTRQELASGYARLAEGWRQSERLEIEDASRSLAAAVVALRAAGSPMLDWARYWLAATHLHRGRFDILRTRLGDLGRRATDPRLRASIARTLGTAASRQRRLHAAETAYRDAIDGFERVGDDASAAVVRGYLSTGVLFPQGRADEGWHLLSRCLRELADWPSGAYRPYLLTAAARVMIRQGRPHAAALTAEESARSLARDTADAVEIAEAWLRLGEARLAAGQEESARESLAPAQAAVANVPDPSLRERLSAEIALAFGLAERDAERAAEALSRAVASYQRLGVRLYLPVAYSGLARSLIRLGRLEEAHAKVELGIREHERALAEFPDALSAAPFADVEQDLFDMAASLAIDQRQDFWGALALADRAKSSPWRSFGAGGTRSVSRAVVLDEVRLALEPREAVVAFTQLESRLLVTIISRTGATHRVVHIEHRKLGERAARLLSLLALRGSASEIDDHAAWLFEQLLGPSRSNLQGVDHVVFVPDRALNLVPFALLRDGGRYLVERFSIAVCPSLDRLVKLRQPRTGRPPSRDWRIGLVSTGPVGDDQSGLGGLPATERELTETAALYSFATVLTGERATAPRLLELLPTIDVLHFAGHASAEPDTPWRARLWLASGHGRRRLEPLLAGDLVRARMDHLQLVVLSGCETAVPSARRAVGSDGLAAAFLSRGATAVVATLWKVEDAAVARLTVHLHRGLARGEDAATALRRAQLVLLRSAAPAERHPSTWAACQLAGLSIRRPRYTGGFAHGLRSDPEVHRIVRSRPQRRPGLRADTGLGRNATNDFSAKGHDLQALSGHGGRRRPRRRLRRGQ